MQDIEKGDKVVLDPWSNLFIFVQVNGMLEYYNCLHRLEWTVALYREVVWTIFHPKNKERALLKQSENNLSPFSSENTSVIVCNWKWSVWLYNNYLIFTFCKIVSQSNSIKDTW